MASKSEVQSKMKEKIVTPKTNEQVSLPKAKVTKVTAEQKSISKYHRRIEKIMAAWSKQKRKSKRRKVILTIIELVLLTAWVLLALEISKQIMYGAMLLLTDVFGVTLNVNATLETVLSAIVYVIDLVITLGVPALIFCKKPTRDSLGLRGLFTWTDIGMGVIGFILSMIAALIVTAIAAAIFPWIDMEQAQEVGYDNISGFKDMMMAFLALVVIAPVAEEIVFRGWLYGKLRRHTWAIPAILLTSVAFGAAHGQWNVGITVGVMSVFMCLIREMTGTVYGGIIVHMLKNGLAFYMLFIYGIN